MIIILQRGIVFYYIVFFLRRVIHNLTTWRLFLKNFTIKKDSSVQSSNAGLLKVECVYESSAEHVKKQNQIKQVTGGAQSQHV